MTDQAESHEEALIRQLAHSSVTNGPWIVRAAVILLVLVLVGLVAIQYQVTRNNDNLDRVEATVEDLRAYVDEVRAASDSETNRAQQQAISRAVALVPEIKDILCDPEAFPAAAANAPACQEEE